MFVQEMLILYSFSLIGFIATKLNVLSENSNEVLSKLVLNITLPSLIIFSLDISSSLSMIKEFTWLICMSFYIMTISILIASKLGERLKNVKQKKPVFESLIIFGNQGFIGFAIIFILFGEQGIVYLVVFNIYYLMLIWTYGIFLFTNKKDEFNIKKLINPGLVSTSIGIIILLLPMQLPHFISRVLEDTGKLTIPLSMIIIGSLMANMSNQQLGKLLKNGYIWIAVLLKLIVIPILLFPFFFLPVPPKLFLIAFIVSGMPSASTVSLYAQNYKADALFASTGVLVSTVFCIITIPFLIIVFELFFKVPI